MKAEQIAIAAQHLEDAATIMFNEAYKVAHGMKSKLNIDNQLANAKQSIADIERLLNE